jgi:hypothetical protein
MRLCNARLLCKNRVFIKQFEETAVSSNALPNESIDASGLGVIRG